MTSCTFFVEGGGVEAKKPKERKRSWSATSRGSGNASRFARVFAEENNALFTRATGGHRDDDER